MQVTENGIRSITLSYGIIEKLAKIASWDLSVGELLSK